MENPLYQTSYQGAWASIYVDRIEWGYTKTKKLPIPLKDIIYVDIAFGGFGNGAVRIEIVGGHDIIIPISRFKKNKFMRTIYKHQARK